MLRADARSAMYSVATTNSTKQSHNAHAYWKWPVSLNKVNVMPEPLPENAAEMPPSDAMECRMNGRAGNSSGISNTPARTLPAEAATAISAINPSTRNSAPYMATASTNVRTKPRTRCAQRHPAVNTLPESGAYCASA